MTSRWCVLILALAVGACGLLLTPVIGGSGQQQAPGTTDAEVATEKGRTMRYGFSGKMTTRPGKRDAVIALLLRDVEKLKEAGCHLYLVGVLPNQLDVVWVTEVWESREAHRASLKLPTVQQAIAEARPLLTDRFESEEVSVVGGLGVPK